MIDQTEVASVPADGASLPPKKYDDLRLTHFRALKDLFAKVRSGEITPDNEDEFLSLYAETNAEDSQTIDESLFDPLLRKQGFYTGRHFYGHLNEAIRELNNNPTPREKAGTFQGTALLEFDLDHFRDANNNYGHDWGDEMLIHVGQIIKEHIKRKQDFLGRSEENKAGRPGGDELTALLYDTDTEGAVRLADEIRKDLEEHLIQTPDGKDWHQTVSIGVCILEPGITAEDAMKRADIALYHSKANGRNRVSVWQKGMAMPPSQPVTVG